MSNTKRPWTPGEWSAFFNTEWEDYWEVQDAQGNAISAECNSVGRDAAESEANALLEAAAPDLYEGLEDVCHCLQFFVAAIGERRPGWEDIHDVMFATAEGTAWDESAKALKAASEALQKAHPKRLEGIEPRATVPGALGTDATEGGAS